MRLVLTLVRAPRGVARPAVTLLEADARVQVRARAIGWDLSWPLLLALTRYLLLRRLPQIPRPPSSTPPLLAELGPAAIAMTGCLWRAPAAVDPPRDPLQLARVRWCHSLCTSTSQSPRGAAVVRIHLAGGRSAADHGVVAGSMRGPGVSAPPPSTGPRRRGLSTCYLGKALSADCASGTLRAPPPREGTSVRRWYMRLRMVAVLPADGTPPTTPPPTSG